MARLDDSRREYSEASFNLRFLATARAALISVFTAVLGGVGAFMWNVYTIVEPSEIILVFRSAIPLSGSAGITIIFFLEKEIIALYRSAFERACELEDVLDIENGMYVRAQRRMPSYRILTVYNVTKFYYTTAMLFFYIFIIRDLVSLVVQWIR